MPSKCGILSEKSAAETKQQVFTEVSQEEEGENTAAGEHLENRRGFYICTEMRKEGRRVCVQVVCVWPGHQEDSCVKENVLQQESKQR